MQDYKFGEYYCSFDMGLNVRGGKKHGKGARSSSRSRCSCFFFLKIFRTWRSPWRGAESDDGAEDGAVSSRPAHLVTDDGFGWPVVVESGIDKRASEFIKKFHETREP